MIAYLNNNKLRNVHFHKSGGLDFSEIGYKETPIQLQEDFEHAKQIYDNWDASVTNRYNAFNGDKKIGYFPAVDTSNVVNMQDMFAKSSLKYVPALNTSNVVNMQYMFGGCTNLTSLDLSSFDTSNVTNMYAMFAGCNNLTSLDLSSFDTSNVTNMQTLLYCSNLKKILGMLNLKSLNQTINQYYFTGYGQQKELRQLTFENIGYGNKMTSFQTTYTNNWGVNSEEVPDARQSLINSLITYSHDRATAGYSTCTITLHANSKAVLTDDEIAQITAKGFTIA